MREEKGPSINLKNINYINKVEQYMSKKLRVASQSLSQSMSRLPSQSQLQELITTEQDTPTKEDTTPKSPARKQSIRPAITLTQSMSQTQGNKPTQASTTKVQGKNPQQQKQNQTQTQFQSQTKGEAEMPIFEREYFKKHVYMMRDKMLDMFKRSESIPGQDKKTIEKEFQRELKSLKLSLKTIKDARRQAFAESNKKYQRIEHINEELQVHSNSTV
jgi:hypothetical protein